MPYETIFHLKVLHEDPIPDDMDLGEVYRQTITGDYSGAWEQETNLITDEECKSKLIEQGSDPSFFGYDDDEDDD